MVKNPPANSGDVRDGSSIPGSGKSPEGGQATHSSIFAWRIPWTEEPGGLRFIGLHRAGHYSCDGAHMLACVVAQLAVCIKLQKSLRIPDKTSFTQVKLKKGKEMVPVKRISFNLSNS